MTILLTIITYYFIGLLAYLIIIPLYKGIKLEDVTLWKTFKESLIWPFISIHKLGVSARFAYEVGPSFSKAVLSFVINKYKSFDTTSTPKKPKK